MKVNATRNKFIGCPPAIAAFGSPKSDTNITIGKEYVVFALSVFNGVVCLQIICDADIIAWLPAWFFEVCDTSLPSDWVCNFTGSNLQMIIGPKFVAANESSYNRMVELDSKSVEEFWQQFKTRPETKE